MDKKDPAGGIPPSYETDLREGSRLIILEHENVLLLYPDNPDQDSLIQLIMRNDPDLTHFAPAAEGHILRCQRAGNTEGAAVPMGVLQRVVNKVVGTRNRSKPPDQCFLLSAARAVNTIHRRFSNVPLPEDPSEILEEDTLNMVETVCALINLQRLVPDEATRGQRAFRANLFGPLNCRLQLLATRHEPERTLSIALLPQLLDTRSGAITLIAPKTLGTICYILNQQLLMEKVDVSDSSVTELVHKISQLLGREGGWRSSAPKQAQETESMWKESLLLLQTLHGFATSGLDLIRAIHHLAKTIPHQEAQTLTERYRTLLDQVWIRSGTTMLVEHLRRFGRKPDPQEERGLHQALTRPNILVAQYFRGLLNPTPTDQNAEPDGGEVDKYWELFLNQLSPDEVLVLYSYLPRFREICGDINDPNSYINGVLARLTMQVIKPDMIDLLTGPDLPLNPILARVIQAVAKKHDNVREYTLVEPLARRVAEGLAVSPPPPWADSVREVLRGFAKNDLAPFRFSMTELSFLAHMARVNMQRGEGDLKLYSIVLAYIVECPKEIAQVLTATDDSIPYTAEVARILAIMKRYKNYDPSVVKTSPQSALPHLIRLLDNLHKQEEELPLGTVLWVAGEASKPYLDAINVTEADRARLIVDFISNRDYRGRGFSEIFGNSRTLLRTVYEILRNENTLDVLLQNATPEIAIRLFALQGLEHDRDVRRIFKASLRRTARQPDGVYRLQSLLNTCQDEFTPVDIEWLVRYLRNKLGLQVTRLASKWEGPEEVDMWVVQRTEKTGRKKNKRKSKGKKTQS